MLATVRNHLAGAAMGKTMKTETFIKFHTMNLHHPTLLLQVSQVE
jgi:hypothetical protein